MELERLRQWLAEVLPLRTATAIVQLGDGDVEQNGGGWVRIPIGIAALERGSVVSFVEEPVDFAHEADLDAPERTRAYLRAWCRFAQDRLATFSDDARSLVVSDVAPHVSVLDDLANETEEDFVAALGNHIHWNSRPDTPPRTLALSDLSATAPTARSEALEDAILASFAPEAFDAYARWLAEHGDPRGQVGVLEAKGTRASSRQAKHVIATHARYFFGPLPGTAEEIFVWGPTIEFDSYRGWIDTARVDLADAESYSGLDRVALLQALFRLPGARFLRRLDVADDASPIAALERSGGHPNLREIALAAEWTDEPALRRLFPRLERIDDGA